MQLVVTSIAVTCLGLHALLGCCWHRVTHAEACTVASVGVGESHGAGAGCCHGGLHQEHEDQDPHSPGQCNCECRGVCNYLPTAKVECQNPDAAGYVVFLPATETFFEFAQPAASRELAQLAQSDGLPLRLHLWNQILLI